MKFYDFFKREKLESLGIYRFGHNWQLQEFEIEEFRNLEDDFIKYHIRGIGPSKARKLLWLRDYLNGKVQGQYKEEKIDFENEEINKLKERLERKDNVIAEIRDSKRMLEEENKQLRAEIKELKKKENIYLKIKEYFLKEEF
jgi:hypothetical protein